MKMKEDVYRLYLVITVYITNVAGGRHCQSRGHDCISTSLSRAFGCSITGNFPHPDDCRRYFKCFHIGIPACECQCTSRHTYFSAMAGKCRKRRRHGEHTVDTGNDITHAHARISPPRIHFTTDETVTSDARNGSRLYVNRTFVNSKPRPYNQSTSPQSVTEPAGQSPSGGDVRPTSNPREPKAKVVFVLEDRPSFPIWAIALVVICVVIVLVMILLLVY